ncbi:MAG: hypothetical protein KKB25_03490 [Nanoarchaeota archaeon]|nr:hypothetical protein [Nanoarchaeota archaeon]
MQNDSNAENSFSKISSIMQIQRLGLPSPETVFVYDAETQEAEIEDFLKDREFVMIRSDKKDSAGKCPHNLKCPKREAKEFIKKLNAEGFAAILQEHVPFNAFASGNIMLLKNKMIIEMMEGSPLTKLNREGKLDEHIRMERFGGRREIRHHGKRLLPRNILKKVIDLVEYLPLENRIVEFAVAPDWMFFWQIRDDKTGGMLE